MTSWKLFGKSTPYILGMGLVVLLFGGWATQGWFEALFYKLEPTPTWQGILPGQTTQQHVIDFFGEPDEVTTRNNFVIHLYQNRRSLGWENVEVWYPSDDLVVFGVFRDFPFARLTLKTFIKSYGKPDKVTWAADCRVRYLIWPRHGVAGVATAYEDLEWDEQWLDEVVIFPPMYLRQFEQHQKTWPWPTYGTGPFPYISCPYDATDTRPEDHYDWAGISDLK